MTIKLGIDWRKPDLYPRGDASRRTFAWEFLRRNPDYLAAWEAFIGRGGDPASDDEPCAKDPQDPRVELPLTVLLARPWGLQCMFDPIHPERWLPGPDWLRTAARVSMPGPGSDHLAKSGQDRTGKIAFSFDLTLPIEPQLDSVANALRARAERWRQKHPELAPKPSRAGKKDGAAFVEMLRILDADVAGDQRGEIVRELWPGEDNPYPNYPLFKRLGTRRQSAAEYRDSKYLDLALADVYAPPRQIKSSS